MKCRSPPLPETNTYESFLDGSKLLLRLFQISLVGRFVWLLRLRLLFDGARGRLCFSSSHGDQWTAATTSKRSVPWQKATSRVQEAAEQNDRDNL